MARRWKTELAIHAHVLRLMLTCTLPAHFPQEQRGRNVVAESLHRHERLHRLVSDTTLATHAEQRLAHM